LAEKLESVGVPCELAYPGSAPAAHAGAQDYILDHLGAAR
jgi:hypothetical protein